MLRRALLLALFLIAVLAPSPARAQIARPVRETRLANGLRLVISPNPAAADVSVLADPATARAVQQAIGEAFVSSFSLIMLTAAVVTLAAAAVGASLRT